MNDSFGRLVIVSNRLPISFEKDGEDFKTKTSSGGLVSALEPLLKKNGGVWVGNAGAEESSRVEELLQKEAQEHPTYKYKPVFLTKEEQEKFYEGFSNEVLWPLFHDLQTRCNFDPDYWDYFLRVNNKFADITAQVATKGDLIWVHDYQLMTMGVGLRRELPQAKIYFFLHIPFPSPDIFSKLPWRKEILEGLLAYDVVGLQTERDLRNFLGCLRSYVPQISLMRKGEIHMVRHQRRKTVVGFFPIGIDFEGFSKAADSAEVEERTLQLKKSMIGVKTILGVDRLDYTKGILERIKAFSTFLRKYPEFRRRTTLIQVAIPSRESIPGYQELKEDIERIITQVNGKFGEPSWVPINYMYRAICKTELLALYQVADVALVTPLKDGMNLVAKEYCAARTDKQGVLVLSEFAGAAAELRHGAILVNPYDELGLAEAMKVALTMSKFEQRRRMLRLRNQVRRSDLQWWVEHFLSVAKYSQFPETIELPRSA
jgi:trehalose 6-phosphate synthase/phosphatase